MLRLETEKWILASKSGELLLDELLFDDEGLKDVVEVLEAIGCEIEVKYACIFSEWAVVIPFSLQSKPEQFYLFFNMFDNDNFVLTREVL